MRNAMNQETISERDSSLNEKAPWEKEEYAPYDVVWLGWMTGEPRNVDVLSAFTCYEDAMLYPGGSPSTHATPVTLDTARQTARQFGRRAVVLRDHEGNEIRRWPV